MDGQAHTFQPWSHVVSLCYAQLTHSIGLDDVADSLQLHSGPLASVRGATAPSRNTLFPPQPGALRRDGRAALLGDAGKLASAVARFCRGAGGGATAPIKSTDVAVRPVNKIMQGDWIWENAGFNPNTNPPSHSYQGQRRFVMLFGDGHVDFYRFPFNIGVNDPVSSANSYW